MPDDFLSSRDKPARPAESQPPQWKVITQEAQRKVERTARRLRGARLSTETPAGKPDGE